MHVIYRLLQQSRHPVNASSKRGSIHATHVPCCNTRSTCTPWQTIYTKRHRTLAVCLRCLVNKTISWFIWQVQKLRHRSLPFGGAPKKTAQQSSMCAGLQQTQGAQIKHPGHSHTAASRDAESALSRSRLMGLCHKQRPPFRCCLAGSAGIQACSPHGKLRLNLSP